MARYVDAKCRQCRAEGVKLFLKGDRCETVKCPVEKREKRPGMHGWKRQKLSEYNIRLREKQKLKKTYGFLEAQFRRIYRQAEQMKGNTGESLLLLAEGRLDNVLFRMGFAFSRAHARQLINHGHVMVNDKKVDVASYAVRKGDVVKPVPKERIEKLFAENHNEMKAAPRPLWLMVEEKPLHGVVIGYPTREEAGVAINTQLIVELCSK